MKSNGATILFYSRSNVFIQNGLDFFYGFGFFLFWRSRAANPITSWYREQCDGMARIQLAGEAWWVLWRGLAPLEIPTAIDHCATTPPDFVS